VIAGAWRARRARGAAARFLAFVGAVPFAPCIALGLGGGGACLEAIMASGVAAAGLHLVASRKSEWADRGEKSGQEEEPALAVILVDVPERLGEWFVSLERWVVDAVAGALAGLTRAGAWMVATVDSHVVATPVDAVAARLVGVARRVNPHVGSMARVVWGVLAAAALTVLVHALWPAR
jgi:hypothetical protein